jgi:acylphosphatase
MGAPVARKVAAYGRVQGVFYRQWTVHQADALGVSGWVHNARDGSVQAHVQGQEEAVGRLIEGMRRGSPQARIDDFTVEDTEPQDIDGFSVRL